MKSLNFFLATTHILQILIMQMEQSFWNGRSTSQVFVERSTNDNVPKVKEAD